MPTPLWQRFFACSLPLALFLLLFTTPATAGGSRHPYFNDRGTLRWYHSFAEAKRVAQREQKLIFVEYGRQACSNCRKLASSVLPHSRIRGRISSLAIGLAAECDRPEREVALLFQQNLRNARMLPFVAFLTPRGRWITGWGGYADVSDLEGHLDLAEARHRSIFGRATRGPAPSLEPTPSFERRASPKSPTPRPATDGKTARTEPAPKIRPAPVQPPAPTPEPAPATPELGYTDLDLEDGIDPEEECADGACVGGNCAPPSFGCTPGDGFDRSGFGGRVLTGIKNFVTGRKDCPPRACPPKTDAVTAVKPQDCLDFPQPAPRIASPETRLADGDFPLPRPQVRPAPIPVPSAMPFGDPDADEAEPVVQPRAPTLMLAETAAKRGDWATVLRLTRDATIDQTALRGLNRQAHAWAHGRLAMAVRAVREERYDEARTAMNEVGRTMLKEPEAVDAQRGLRAVEMMRDMLVLSEDSPLRSTVRKTSYEKMRGTRWAPLFSEVPAPSPALTTR